MGEVTIEMLGDILSSLLQVCTVRSIDGEKNEIHTEARIAERNDDGEIEMKKKRAICKVLTWGVTEVKYLHNFSVNERILCYFPYGVSDDPVHGYALGTFFGEYGLTKPPERNRGDGIYFADEEGNDNGYLKFGGEGAIIAKVADDIVLQGRAIQLN